MQLSEEQKNFFQTFGYLAIPQLFSAAESELIIDGFEWSIQNRGGGEEQVVPVAPCVVDRLNTVQKCVLSSTTLL